MPEQPEINKSMRGILIDWLVEVQESFELNHETLYTAVKMMDLFLSRFNFTFASLNTFQSFQFRGRCEEVVYAVSYLCTCQREWKCLINENKNKINDD
jgi:hypothetical protein